MVRREGSGVLREWQVALDAQLSLLPVQHTTGITAIWESIGHLCNRAVPGKSGHIAEKQSWTVQPVLSPLQCASKQSMHTTWKF